MKQFMDKDFLLSTQTAKDLFHNTAEHTPVLDYHCHINPKEIYENRTFDTITQVWLGGDHYKWRQMRGNGIDEKYITGDATDLEKFKAWAATLQKLIGNPLYHWSHLELQRYFGYSGYLNEDTAEEVFNLCNAKLKDLPVRKLIEMSNVTLICTTDDPADDLKYQKLLQEDKTFKTQVLPCFRPDKAMNIEKVDYLDYLKKLGSAAEVNIDSFAALKKALKNRTDFFNSLGCRACDHALEYVMYAPADEKTIEDIFAKRFSGKEITRAEEMQFKTAFMQYVASLYHELGWAMQLHYGCKRDNNTPMFDKLGPDTGFDTINNYAPSSEMADFLNSLSKTHTLPKTIIYSLNPNDNASIVTTMNCFQDADTVGKIQQGSAWWFNDHKQGMIDQMTTLANDGNLGNFIGMLTDSRSFLSYTRHEYFRRILCEWIGNLVENGEYPNDKKTLESLVSNISYYNAVKYFGFKL